MPFKIIVFFITFLILLVCQIFSCLLIKKKIKKKTNQSTEKWDMAPEFFAKFQLSKKICNFSKMA